MECTIVIMSKRKEKDGDGKYGYLIEHRETVSEDQIAQFTLEEWKEGNTRMRSDREYFAELEVTRH